MAALPEPFVPHVKADGSTDTDNVAGVAALVSDDGVMVSPIVILHAEVDDPDLERAVHARTQMARRGMERNGHPATGPLKAWGPTRPEA